MKIQALAIIAIMLLLPMTLILSSYVKNQTKTLDYQISYDTKLQNATYDALKAFQLNSSNSDTSDISNSKLRDVKAGANTFFNALASAFDMSGYGKEELQNFVPAIVFTMYDGYYIYGPFQNVLTKDAAEQFDALKDSSLGTQTQYNTKYKPADNLEDLKPYVYYSCRYISDDRKLDVVITYALDNYVVIQGRYGETTIDVDGYLLNRVSYVGPTPLTKDNVLSPNTYATYRGTTIKCENDDSLKERVFLNGEVLEALVGTTPEDDHTDTIYNPSSPHLKHDYFHYLRCRKINGVRYYTTEGSGGYSIKPTEHYPNPLHNQQLVLTLLNGEWSVTNYVSDSRRTSLLGIDSNQQGVNDIINNTNALEYYKKAARLKAFLTGNSDNSYPAIYAEEILSDMGVDLDRLTATEKSTLIGNIKRAGEEIGKLKVKNACTLDGKSIIGERDNPAVPDDKKLKNLEYFGTGEEDIFEFGSDLHIDNENTSSKKENKIIDIEEPQSNFNEHRLDVIRYSIESNLSTAINNFNSYSNSTTYDFQMPRLKDTDWEKIYNNISIISFMQGLSIGGKIYSGYSVVPNNNNKEVVTEDSIVFVYNDGSENKVYDAKADIFVDKKSAVGVRPNIPNDDIETNVTAVSKATVSRASSENLETGEVKYFYRYPDTSGWYDYDSIVTTVDNNSDYLLEYFNKGVQRSFKYTNMYDYIEGFKEMDKENIAKKYFTALGRERQGMYRVHNNGVFKTLYENDPF